MKNGGEKAGFETEGEHGNVLRRATEPRKNRTRRTA
jgi:hypothetical protein